MPQKATPRPTRVPPPRSRLGELARAARDALLEQRPDQLHRVADLIEAVLAAEADAAPVAVTLDEGLARRLRAAE